MELIVSGIFILICICLLWVYTKRTKTMKEDNIKVTYSRNYKKRAKELFNMLCSMRDFSREKFGCSIDISMNVFGRTEWVKEYKRQIPYGMPFIIPSKTESGEDTVVLPATRDGVIVQENMEYRDMLPKEAKNLFKESGLTFKECIMIFPDLTGYHEVGHTIVRNSGLKNLNKWTYEFLSTYCAYSFIMDKEPALGNVWLGNAYISYIGDDSPQYTSLEDFHSIYADMSVKNYDWYQKKFALLAGKVYEKNGPDFFIRAVDELKNKNLDANSSVIALEKAAGMRIHL